MQVMKTSVMLSKRRTIPLSNKVQLRKVNRKFEIFLKNFSKEKGIVKQTFAKKQKLQNFIDKLRYISINKVVLFGRDEFKRLVISQNRKNDVTELVHYSR